MLLMFTCLGVSAAGQPGQFGIGFKVETEGFMLNPKLKSVVVSDLQPGLPADKAGIKVGDEVVEADGKTIAGASAFGMRSTMHKDAGQALTLKLKHPTGDSYTITMVAVPKT
ncbi:PDZ domain-containing protein [Dyella choica]|nr:PDZ domain-containing protein [Dyella choica]